MMMLSMKFFQNFVWVNNMDIKKAQSINLLLLKEFDRFCKKHNVEYRLDSGTLLGAVRHKGFIPWDDDCDVCMKKNEYNKFIKALLNDSLNENFKFIKSSETKNEKYFHDFTDRIFYTNEIYRNDKIYEKYFDGYYKYLWLDIFIIEEYKGLKSMLKIFKLIFLYSLAMGHRINLNLKNYKGFFTKASVFILSNIGKLFSLRYIKYKYFQILESETNGKTIENKGFFYLNYPMPYIGFKTCYFWEKDFFETQFENLMLPIPRFNNEMLIKMYGDYKKEPEEKNKIPNHQNIF